MTACRPLIRRDNAAIAAELAIAGAVSSNTLAQLQLLAQRGYGATTASRILQRKILPPGGAGTATGRKNTESFAGGSRRLFPSYTLRRTVLCLITGGRNASVGEPEAGYGEDDRYPCVGYPLPASR
ncbi:hypothetical protein KCP77_01870 [Salmonella enterica subsp. enterica]|nr:hypothetical protein KCP77_01870 [Salmonella enterica subsp. enterica]